MTRRYVTFDDLREGMIARPVGISGTFRTVLHKIPDDGTYRHLTWELGPCGSNVTTPYDVDQIYEVQAGPLTRPGGLPDAGTGPYEKDAPVGSYTINVSGPERHDGEKPYTYVLAAPCMTEAKRRAWLWHLWVVSSERGTVPLTAPSPADPKTVTGTSAELMTVVVIDCPQFPCHPGQPFDCPDPYHHTSGRAPAVCRCPYHWSWIFNGDPGDRIDTGRLQELGYDLPDIAPQETQW